MSQRAAVHDDEDRFTSRPAKQAISEIAGMSIMGVVVSFVLMTFPFNEGFLERGLRRVQPAGEAALENIGWGLGIYTSVLLGFYAIVIGGQLTKSPSAPKTRRTLGFTAEAIAGALSPALLLVLIVCIGDPEKSGALFVIVPVAALLFFLSVQLGGFVVFEKTEKLEMAKQTRDWARERLDGLEQRGQKVPWGVFTANVLTVAILGIAMTAFLTERVGLRDVFVVFLVYCFLVLLLVGGSAIGVYWFHTARDRYGKLVSWLIPIAAYLAALGLTLDLFMTSAVLTGTAVLMMTIFCLVSILWPRDTTNQHLLDWTLKGAATALAHRKVKDLYEQKCKEADDLTQELKPEHEQPLYFWLP